MRCNIRLIEYFVKAGCLRQYAFYMKMKGLYVHSCFFDFNVSKVARMMGVSRDSVRRYVKFFEENGWGEMRDGHFVLIGHGKLKRKYGVTLKADAKVDSGVLNDVVNGMRYLVVKFKESQFRELKRRSCDLHSPRGLGSYKAALQFFRDYSPVDENAIYRVRMDKMGEMVGVSMSTMSRLIGKWEGMGKVKVRRDKKGFGKMGVVRVPYGMYVSGGVLWKVSCNSYEF